MCVLQAVAGTLWVTYRYRTWAQDASVRRQRRGATCRDACSPVPGIAREGARRHQLSLPAASWPGRARFASSLLGTVQMGCVGYMESAVGPAAVCRPGLTSLAVATLAGKSLRVGVARIPAAGHVSAQRAAVLRGRS
eukprot:14735907-Alexandrium_andersonii.AAC.1